MYNQQLLLTVEMHFLLAALDSKAVSSLPRFVEDRSRLFSVCGIQILKDLADRHINGSCLLILQVPQAFFFESNCH